MGSFRMLDMRIGWTAVGTVVLCDRRCVSECGKDFELVSGLPTGQGSNRDGAVDNPKSNLQPAQEWISLPKPNWQAWKINSR